MSNRQQPPHFGFRDADDHARLREAFERAGFNESGLRRRAVASGMDAAQADQVQILPVCGEKGRPLETLVRLFVCGVPQDLESARAALRPVEPHRCVEAGLLAVEGAEARAMVRIMPFTTGWVASDWPPEYVRPVAPDHVQGVSSAALTLARRTIRRRIAAALDVGTGCGVQALLAAAHSDHIVATDINPRAARFAGFSARLSGLRHVRPVIGDLTEPAADQRFGLVVSNPPFVISPALRYTYRDAGMSGDAFLRRVVRKIARVLAEGGFAQILGNWAHHAGADPRRRLAEWFDPTGCDVWAMTIDTGPAARYAENWIHVSETVERRRFVELFDEWTAYFEREGIEAISYGLITMRRRTTGRPNWFDLDDQWPQIGGQAGRDIAQLFELRDYLAGSSDQSLLDAKLRLSPSVRMDTQFRATDGSWRPAHTELRRIEGLGYRIGIDASIAGIAVRCDGRRPLRALIEELARVAGVDFDAAAKEVLDAARKLIARGCLLPKHVSDDED